MLQFDEKKYDENGNYIERMPILLSGFPDGEERLLEIPTIPDGKAKTVARKLHEVTTENNALELIVAVNADTPTSNSGQKGGSLVEFDRIDGKSRLHAYCKNHVGDLQQKRSYKVVFSTTKSPANADFKKFRQKFPSLDLKSITPKLNRKFTHPIMKTFLEQMRKKCTEALLRKDLRSDRRQYAELCLHINGFELPSN